MNSKQLFFVSLIILSIAMGLNWFKNRAKFVKKQPPIRTRQAVNLDDLQLQENIKDKEDAEEDEDKDKEEENDDKENKNDKKKYEGEVNEEDDDVNEEDENKEKKEDGEENKIKSSDSNASDSLELLASDSLELLASDSQIIDNPLKDDPIMQEYFKLTRNPFETSPYAQLVEKLRLEAEIAAQPVVVVKEKVKIPKILGGARFTGTIETARGPKAIIDGGLYEKGNEFNNYVIKEVKMNYIILESQDGEWLLPKTGVDIKIDQETGKYTVSDSYE